MVMLIEADDEPPLLFAQTTYWVRVMFTVGIPDIVPLSNARPFGSAGSIDHD